jgi:hypothetical protein
VVTSPIAKYADLDLGNPLERALDDRSVEN